MKKHSKNYFSQIKGANITKKSLPSVARFISEDRTAAFFRSAESVSSCTREMSFVEADSSAIKQATASAITAS
jgi:hypothetical protein